MPSKRRIEKGAKLSDYHRQMLIEGPETMLLAGVGFMEGRRAAVFANADAAERRSILKDMRSAWHRHGGRLLIECSNPGRSTLWANQEFGKP